MKRSRGAHKAGLPARPRPAQEKGLADEGGAETPSVRLQKFMAQAGVGSRRHCEELITSGRVQIDGRTVTELGTKVAKGQRVEVDGTSLTSSRLVHYLVNKPTGVVSTNFDPAGRPRVIDLLPQVAERLFTVGRLDMSSEGLILVTNDGELANRLAHPRFGVEKTYLVQVAGTLDHEALATLRRGVHLAEGLARATSARIKKSLKQSTILEIVLSEGKNREIRRILAKVGHKVVRLTRIAFGPVRLGEMAPGEFRPLTPDELKALRGHRTGRSSTRKRAAANARPHMRPTGVREKPATAPTPTKKPAAGNFGTILLPEELREAKPRPERAPRAGQGGRRVGGQVRPAGPKRPGRPGRDDRAPRPGRPAREGRPTVGAATAAGAVKARKSTGSKLRRKHKGRRP